MNQRVIHAIQPRQPDMLGLVMLLVTTAVVALTFNAVVVVLWLSCWTFAKTYSDTRPAQMVVFLVIGILFFYPEFTTVFKGYHEKWVVLAVLLTVGAIFARGESIHPDSLLHRVVVVWIGWGLVAYMPVLIAFLWSATSAGELPQIFTSLPHATSGLKTVAPIIPAALIAPLVVAALTSAADLRRFRQAMTAAVFIITAVSFVFFVLGMRILPFDESRVIADTTRFGTFSNPDPNGTARLLLFPVLLFTSASLGGRRLLGFSGWLALVLGVLAILLTQSRTTFGSLSAGLAVVALFNLRNRRAWWVGSASAILVIVAVLTVDFQRMAAGGGERFTSDSLVFRMALWDAALDIIRANPWVGAFPGGYFEAMQLRGARVEEMGSAHSLYLALAVEWGVALVGIAVLAMFVTVRRGWGAVRRASRNPDAIESHVAGVAAVATTVAYAVHGFTEVVPALFLFFILGLAVAAHRLSTTLRRDGPR